MNKNRVAGIYSSSLSIVGILLSLTYAIWYLIVGRTADSEGFGAMLLTFAIILFFMSLILFFSANAIIKDKKWGKILALIIFIIFTVWFALTLYVELTPKYVHFSFSIRFVGEIVLFLISLSGVIFTILSLIKKFRH
jgi:hypothetical protein